MMTQTQTNTGDYFTLDNPSLNNKPQPTTATVLQPQQQKKGGLLNRRQAQATYLHQIELPSLPPLSHLLTTDSEAKENNDAAVAAAVAASVQQQNQAMGSLGYPIMPQQQPYFDAVAAAAAASSVVVNPAQTTTDFMPQHHTNTVSSTADFVPVTTQHHDATTMMDPTAAFTMDPMYAAMSMPPTTQPGTMMPLHTQAPTRARQSSHSSESSAEKIYSFVAIPGTNHKKRPRRRYDEIERLYHCNWPDCTKSYGTLNHLNAHVSMQKHVSINIDAYLLRRWEILIYISIIRVPSDIHLNSKK